MENEIEFNHIISDIIRNKKFIELKDENHHGISRLEHSLNVAHIVYYICKKLRMKNLVSATRAALMHDFFTSEDMNYKNSLVNHPAVACENAIKYFNINALEQNIIKSHMFPTGIEMPKYKESFIVTLADKLAAIYECTRYKVPLKTGIYLFFILNLYVTVLCPD